MGLVMIPALISMWINPPRYAWWGTSGVLPRALVVVGLPSVLLLVTSGIWALFDREPELTMDGTGIVAKTLFRIRRVGWDEIASVKMDNREESVLFVSRVGTPGQDRCGCLRRGMGSRADRGRDAPPQRR
jgi:hypothetical protein